jgi:hypothetical protein
MTKPKRPRTEAARETKNPELTERELAQLERQKERSLTRNERPEAKFVREQDGEKTNLTIKAADEQDEKLHGVAMMEAFGTRSVPFLNDTLDNINRVLSRSGIPTEQQYNGALAILAAVEPQNELEATLASQMVAANECAFRCMQGMLGSDWADHHKMYGEMANKFMRTFTAQVEALAKLRRGGEQVVKHVYVQEGGQAVIAGTVNTGGRSNIGSDGQPYGAATVTGGAPLPGPDAARHRMPVAGNAEREVQNSWGQEPRAAEGQ